MNLWEGNQAVVAVLGIPEGTQPHPGGQREMGVGWGSPANTWMSSGGVRGTGLKCSAGD